MHDTTAMACGEFLERGESDDSGLVLRLQAVTYLVKPNAILFEDQIYRTPTENTRGQQCLYVIFMNIRYFCQHLLYRSKSGYIFLSTGVKLSHENDVGGIRRHKFQKLVLGIGSRTILEQKRKSPIFHCQKIGFIMFHLKSFCSSPFSLPNFEWLLFDAQVFNGTSWPGSGRSTRRRSNRFRMEPFLSISEINL